MDVRNDLEVETFLYGEEKALENITIGLITPFNISNAEVFSKPHNHLLLGLYC